MHIAELPHGYARLNDDGTWTLFPVKFKQIGDDFVRIDYSAAGEVLRKSFHQVRALLTVNTYSGEVETVQTGFVLDHELTEPSPPPGKTYVRVDMADLESMYVQVGEVRVFAYWYHADGSWKRMDDDAIEQRIADIKKVNK